jgi:xylulose-5-phosphate/fructose-6-phosphate phosphoketolase
VVDLFKIQSDREHPHGLAIATSTDLFTIDKPIIFNSMVIPWLIHRLTYNRTNHQNLHVRGYKERGNINTPMELAIDNEIDRYTLAIDVIDRVPDFTQSEHTQKKSFAMSRSAVVVTHMSSESTDQTYLSGAGRS